MKNSFVPLAAAFAALFSVSLIANPQTLDWSGDITVFGSPDDESRPAIVVSPTSGRLRALCLRGDSIICSKISTDGGASWDPSYEYSIAATPTRLTTTSDDAYAYIVTYNSNNGSRRLFRFTHSSTEWNNALQVDIGLTHTFPTEDVSVMSDYLFSSSDTYLNTVWIERDSPAGQCRGWFTQSRNQGSSFLPERQIFEAEDNDTAMMHVALAAAWQGDEERLIVAADVERPGSVPPQVLIYISDDQGISWTDGRIVDSTAVAQTEPSLAAYSANIIVAYTRYSGFQTGRDIYYCFSIDGGNTFTPPQIIAHSALQEHSPLVSYDATTRRFHILYLTSANSSDSASLYVTTCSHDSLWNLRNPELISAEGGVIVQGGYAVASGMPGVAAVWTSRFILGDTDIRFDAAWRCSGAAENTSNMPTSIILGDCYPNPFNTAIVIPLTLNATDHPAIEIVDILGQCVRVITTDGLGLGMHRITVDMSNFGSGMYFICLSGMRTPIQKIVLIR